MSTFAEKIAAGKAAREAARAVDPEQAAHDDAERAAMLREVEEQRASYNREEVIALARALFVELGGRAVGGESGFFAEKCFTAAEAFHAAAQQFRANLDALTSRGTPEPDAPEDEDAPDARLPNGLPRFNDAQRARMRGTK